MDQSQACVYLYRNPRNNQILYVGRGKTPDRATEHLSGSHNPGLADQISAGDYTLEIAGPYAGQHEAALVEAALISALHLPSSQAKITNLAAGHGIKFRPFGVPSEFAGRALLPPVTLAEVGDLTGGALIVRNSFGGDLEEGRPRLNPVSPDQDAVVADNICRHWLLQRLVPAWDEDPSHVPVWCWEPPVQSSTGTCPEPSTSTATGSGRTRFVRCRSTRSAAWTRMNFGADS